MKNFLIGLALILALLMLLLKFAENIYLTPCQEPVKVKNIPENSSWYGGCDGGYWLTFIKESKKSLRFQIYHDFTGELQLDAEFETIPECLKFESSEIYDLVEDVTESSIVLKKKLNGVNCVLKPSYPAYGGEVWEMMNED